MILTVASDDVRTALFEMKEIQATLTANQQQLELSMAAMAQMESELDRLVLERICRRRLEKAQTQLEQGRIQYEELELKRDELAANVDDLRNAFCSWPTTSCCCTCPPNGFAQGT